MNSRTDKRGKRLVVLLFALGMTMLTATAPVAAKGKPVKPPEPAIESCASIPPIKVTKGGYTGIECEWTPAHDAVAPSGKVEVKTLLGEISWVVVVVRDSNPGDICVLESWDRPSGVVAALFPLVDGAESYWDSSTHWCSRFDGDDYIRDDPNGDPLNLVVNVQGKRGAVVEVTLTPGQVSSP
jgi:hypothetical protein